MSDNKKRKIHSKVSGGNFCLGASLGVEHFRGLVTVNLRTFEPGKIQQ
jgi:hypothetical protein